VTATSRVPTKRVMTMTRVFDAPRDLVWRVYTEPEHVVHWLSAATWTTPSADIDLRRGGTINVEMRPLDPKEGEGFVFGGTYDEVREPELIVLVIGDGRIMRTEFEDAGSGKTKLTLSWEMAMDEELERGGYTQILDKLTEYLRDRRTGEREIVITRVFDAPREAVFEAWTTAEAFRQWFGPKRATLSVAEFDPHSGRAFAFFTRFDDGDGTEYWSRGMFREVVAPRRIVMTLAGNAPDGSIIDTVITVTFLDRGARTLMLLHQTDKNPALRDAFIGGWSDGLDKLAEYLAKR
jgi:uncharacterized protein YndB with AHSA1/START domain